MTAIYRGKEGEERVASIIWRLMAEHYAGAVDPKNPSLMAERLFNFARAIYDEIEIGLEREYDDLFYKKNEKIEILEAEIRELKGLPPLPPTPMAQERLHE